MDTPIGLPEQPKLPPARVVWGNREGLLKDQNQSVDWDEIVTRTYVLVWLPLIEEARGKGETELSVDAGDPHEESGRSFFTASEQFLKRENFKFTTAEIPPAHEGERWRLTITFKI